MMRKVPCHDSGPAAVTWAAGGFTLTELMVAVSLSGVMVAGALGTFIQQRNAMHATQIVTEMQQNVRTGLDMVCRDLRMAGYGINVPPADLPQWIDWAKDIGGNPVTIDANPKLIDGGNGADGVWVVAAFDAPTAALSADANAGSTVLQLGNGEGARFNTSDKKVLYLGKVETVRITNVSGNTLTISTSPTGSTGLMHGHPAGSVIELVKVRSYEHVGQVNYYPHRPHLVRDDSIAGAMYFNWQRLIAGDIINFQLSQSGKQVTVDVTGRASVRDSYHTGALNGDFYRQSMVSSKVLMRNLP